MTVAFHFSLSASTHVFTHSHPLWSLCDQFKKGPPQEIPPWQVRVYSPHQNETNGTQLPQATTSPEKVNLHRARALAPGLSDGNLKTNSDM